MRGIPRSTFSGRTRHHRRGNHPKNSLKYFQRAVFAPESKNCHFLTISLPKNSLKYFQRAVFAPESKNCHFLTISLPKNSLKYFQRAVFAPESKNCHFLTISLPKSAHHCTNSNPFLLADFPTFATVAKGYPTSCHRGKNVVCLNMETLTH